MALTSKAFDELITFTRASTATFIGANGLIQTAAVDQPRFEFDFAAGESKGILVEPQRTNLFVGSTNVGAPAPGGTTATVTPNSVSAPDGSNDASVLQTFQGDQGYVNRNTVIPTGAVSLGISVFLKSAAPQTQYIGLRVQAPFPDLVDVVIDKDTGEVVFELADGGASVLTSAKATKLADGWWRVQIGVFFPASSGTVSLISGGQSGIRSVAATDQNNDNTVHIFGLQAEEGVTTSSYIPTIGSTVTRSKDANSADTTPWLNSVEGTFIIEFSGGIPANFNRVFQLSPPLGVNTSERLSLTTSDVGTLSFAYVTPDNSILSNVAVTGAQGSIPAKGIVAAMAYNFSTREIRCVNLTLDPVQVVSSQLPDQPSFENLGALGVGETARGLSQFGGNIKSLKYFPKSLTDEELLAAASIVTE